MSEDYSKQIEDAVEAVRREEGNGKPFSDEQAKLRIDWHLGHNFVESLKGKGVNPVPNDFSKLHESVSYEDCLKRLGELRFRDVKRDHEGKQ